MVYISAGTQLASHGMSVLCRVVTSVTVAMHCLVIMDCTDELQIPIHLCWLFPTCTQEKRLHCWWSPVSCLPLPVEQG